MTAESESELKFEIGHVLLIDLVGYSKLLINEQRDAEKRNPPTASSNSTKTSTRCARTRASRRSSRRSSLIPARADNQWTRLVELKHAAKAAQRLSG